MKCDFADLDQSSADTLIRDIWQVLPDGVREVRVFNTGDGRLVVSALPVRRVGRYGFCVVTRPATPRKLDVAAEAAVCASWFDSSYSA